jgi:hypothetical protein
LKTEKLKISRSIVAAIREQKGRFLERDAKKGTWYDIGDKKAIEKTSQALREGQPKLRAKMVEMGQIPPEQGVESVQHQLGNGIYTPRQTPSINSIGSIGSMGSIGSFSAPNPYAMHSHLGSMTSMGSRQPSLTDTMPPPPSRTMSNDMNITNEMAMMQRLSLTGHTNGPSSIPSWTPSITSINTATIDEVQARSVRNRMRTSMNSRSSFQNEMGMSQSTISMMYDTSIFGGLPSERQLDMGFPESDRIGSLDQVQIQNHQQQERWQNPSSGSLENPLSPTPLPPNQIKETSPGNRFDRRRFFAKMKALPGSTRNAGNDGMPDIHMVDSQFSLLSNLSGHGSRHHSNMDVSGHHGESKEISKESMGSEYIGVGSRRSLMSGMSKLSNHSDHFNNPFSDLSRKIGGMTNHSVRSVAMSEISGIEEEGDFAEDDMDEFSFDLPTARPL